MPRAPHTHHYNVIVSIRGKRVRFGCESCPVTDPYWYSMLSPVDDVLKGAPASDRVQSIALARATRRLTRLGQSAKAAGNGLQRLSDGLKAPGGCQGPGGGATDPLGASTAVGFTVTADHHDEDGTRVIDKVELISYGPDGRHPVFPTEHGLMKLDVLNGSTETHGVNSESKEGTVQLDPEHPHADTPEVPDFTEEQLRALKVKPDLIAVAKEFDIPRRSVLSKDDLVTKILEAQRSDR